jgi:hypothetical protein
VLRWRSSGVEFDGIICHFVMAINVSTWKFHIVFWSFIWSICIWLWVFWLF